MNVSASTKYYVLIGLSAVGAALTYITGQPTLTEATVIGGVLVGVSLAVHDLESSTPPAAAAPAA
jgi:hypothetical protein